VQNPIMIINFVGIFNAPGYVGEVSDETHIAREFEALGHTVNRVPRDIWKAYCDGERDPVWTDRMPIDADFNLIAKWPHFNSGKYIEKLKIASKAPVFYWVWDFMDDQGLPDWHIKMAYEADLYLSGELGIFDQYKKHGIRPYYFQMDVCDGSIPKFSSTGEEKLYNIVFTGSCIGQGNRKEWLPIINQKYPVKIFSWNWEEWQKLGLDASPALYGEEYNKMIAQSRIVLGFNVEPNCWGYWSNRIGKVMTAGGFLLQQYAPGMEQFMPEGAVGFFSTPEEAIEKIGYFLSPHTRSIDQPMARRFTSAVKVRQLATLMERYLKGDPSKWLL
jgi:hypothetical protein